MIKKYKNSCVTWVDVYNPTSEDIRSLMDEYQINLDVARELQLPTYKEKIITYKDHLYLVLHFPVLRHSHNKNSYEQEIDLVVGKDFIITTRYENIDALDKFTKTFELDNILKKGLMGSGSGCVLYYMIKELYNAMSDELDSLHDNLKQIEKNIFKGKEKEMVTEISKINRELISFNHIILTHKDILNSLKNDGSKMFGQEFSEHLSKIINEYHRIEKNLINDIDFLRELRNTNDSLLSSKQNSTMKVLTVITFLALPFSIITGFFQMNTTNTPIVGDINDWQIIISMELTAVILAFVFVKIKKWI
jgi:magnesium transporter